MTQKRGKKRNRDSPNKNKSEEKKKKSQQALSSIDEKSKKMS